jgi:hypothetical protein
MIVYPQNEHSIHSSDEYLRFEKDINEIIEFFELLSELIFENGYVMSYLSINGNFTLGTELLDSSIKTLKNAKYCCSNGSFSDANILIRKFRDDLTLFLYLLEIINTRIPYKDNAFDGFIVNGQINAQRFIDLLSNDSLNPPFDDDEKCLEAWFSNTINELPWKIRKKLSVENYINRLKQNSQVKRILTEYLLENFWEKIRTILNGYVHNNGRLFTYQNLALSTDSNLDYYLRNLITHIENLSTIFISILILVDSKLICSSDYIDYLDSGLEPPEDSQYYIAGFIQNFIDAKVVALHPELKSYLKDNNKNGMKIE